MKINLIVENKTYEEDIKAEHGLALLIETDEKTILFDAGASDALIDNAKTMGLDFADVDFAVLSHGHYDHSGGFPAFHRINPEAYIYLQENALKESYAIGEDGKADGSNIGVQWTPAEKAELASTLKFINEPVYITDNIIISGTIPRELREYNTERFLEKVSDKDGEDGGDEKYIPDEMEHEQFLIIKENGKLYIFNACCHNGVVPVVEYAKQLFPNDEIRLIFGGFHLYGSAYDPLLAEVQRITQIDAELFMPVHCTGLMATHRMMDILGERCILMNAGEKEYL